MNNKLKNYNIRKLTTITIVFIFVSTSLFPSISANELHKISGYLYVNDKLAPYGVLIRLRFPELCVFGVTDSSGYYEINFVGFEGEIGNFIINYNGVICYPVDNQSVYIDPNITDYNIDLHIDVLPINVYVDDDFNNTTPGWQIDYFNIIQDGINAVNEHGSVFVYNGTYYENILINKSINLIGENKNSTVLNSTKKWDVVKILANSVNISGFTIENGENGIKLNSNNNDIIDNNINSNIYGIFIEDSNNNYIGNNIIASNKFEGLYLDVVENSVISENLIIDSIVGVNLDYSKNIIINDNCIDSILQHGIRFFKSTNNMIKGNNISNTNDDGIYLSSSDNNMILDNTVIYHDEGIYNYKSNFTLILNNIIYFNDDGIRCDEGNNLIIKNNELNSNNRSGIFLWNSSFNNITSNSVMNNNFGMWICSIYYNDINKNYITDNDEGIWACDIIGNNITSNKINNNSIGVKIDDSIDNLIFKNNFINNVKNAKFQLHLLTVSSSINIWSRNYWDRPRILPKLVFGEILVLYKFWIPWFNIDLRPAKELYEI